MTLYFVMLLTDGGWVHSSNNFLLDVQNLSFGSSDLRSSLDVMLCRLRSLSFLTLKIEPNEFEVDQSFFTVELFSGVTDEDGRFAIYKRFFGKKLGVNPPRGLIGHCTRDAHSYYHRTMVQNDYGLIFTIITLHTKGPIHKNILWTEVKQE